MDAKLVVDQDDIEQAFLIFKAPSSEWQTGITLTPVGAQKMAEYTTSNSGRYLLIARDEVVVFSFLVDFQVLDGELVLGGGLGLFRARALAAQLNNEPLPFKLTVKGVDLE